jgi:hypothetical protein
MKQNEMLIGGLLVVALFYALSTGMFTQSQVSVGGTPTAPGAGAYCASDADGLVTLQVAGVNPENAALDYEGNPIYATDANGVVLASGTATAGTSTTYTALTVPCGATGTVYATGNTTFASGKVSFSATQAQNYVTYKAYDAGTEPMAYIRDSALANDTASIQANGLAFDPTSNAHTLGTGSSLTFYVDIQQNSSSAGFGDSDGNGMVVTVDLANNAVITQNDFALTGFGLRKVSCSDAEVALAATNNNAEICYVAPALKSSDGLQRLSGSARWSAGNPGASDDAKIYFDDLVQYQDTDGKIKKGAFSAAGTNVGQTQAVVTIDTA